MVYTILLVLLTIDSLILIAAVLLQAGQGQGLASTFGGVSSSTSSLLGTRQTGNLLTKLSWWGGGVFLFIAFVLSLMSGGTRQPRSVLDEIVPAQTAPISGGANPAVPLTPAPTPATPTPNTKQP